MKGEKGFTVLEIVIGLVITSMLGAVVAAAIPMAMQWAPRQANKLGVEADLSFARYWLTRDANAAETFIPLSSPQYGSLQWRDFSGASMVSYNVTYSYNSATTSLIREEWQNNVLLTSLPIARKILSQSDTQFTWSPATGRLTTNVTATIVDAPGVGTHSRSVTVVTTLRPAPELAIAPPGEVPTPPPVPGSQIYYITVQPTIITGSYVSGNVASLQSVDINYYVVNSASIPGAKAVIWWGESQTMTAPPTISQIEVRFTGKSSKTNISVEFFVKDSAAGFPVTPTSGFTFTAADTDTTRSFYLDATALAYVNSLAQRKVTFKIETTGSAVFTLSTNQVLFIASPP